MGSSSIKKGIRLISSLLQSSDLEEARQCLKDFSFRSIAGLFAGTQIHTDRPADRQKTDGRTDGRTDRPPSTPASLSRLWLFGRSIEIDRSGRAVCECKYGCPPLSSRTDQSIDRSNLDSLIGAVHRAPTPPRPDFSSEKRTHAHTQTKA